MSIDNKTLADAQPGGRVRLEDWLPPIRKDEPLRSDKPISVSGRIGVGVDVSIILPGQFREALKWVEDAANCSSHRNHKTYRFALAKLLAAGGSKEAGNA